MKKLYLLFILFTTIANAQEPFITTWTVNEGDLTIEVPVVYDSANNYTVDFGDGTILTNQTGLVSHTYSTTGFYTVTLSGNFGRVDFSTTPIISMTRLGAIEQWGDIQWTSMENAFSGCGYIDLNTIDVPDLSQATSLKRMFENVYSTLNESLNNWDVSNISDMSEMFKGANDFNQPLNNWDVSNVTNMSGMFENAAEFNQSLNNWNISDVINMSGMFRGAHDFDQPISNWDVSNVTNMSEMFKSAYNFNQSLNNWDVSNVTDMSSMFRLTAHFNQPLDNWDVSSVTNMSSMFRECLFNQLIDNWDVSSVTNMEGMFYGSLFNQPIDNWNVSNVTDMSLMFCSSNFNQPLNSWNVSNVTTMRSMFNAAHTFNQPLNNWDISNVLQMGGMLSAGMFNQDISDWDFNPEITFDSLSSNVGFISFSTLDMHNVDALLYRFVQLGLQNKIIKLNNLNYCDEAVLDYLEIQLGWIFISGSLAEECIGNNISGNVIYDENADGCDIEDPPTGNFLVTADNGEFTYSTISSNGAYDLSVMEDTYTVELLNVPDYYTVTPSSSSVGFTGFGNEEELNFCLTANETISDLNITLLSIDEARPGFESHYQLVVQNIGTQTITNVSANLIYNETIQSFVESSQAPATTTANQLTFDLATLLPFESKVIDFTMETFTPPTVNGGETISFTASVTPDTGDYTPNDNIYNLEQLVVNSYDPNDKRVMQGEEIYIEDTDEYLDYVIRFQNTGTASAITVRIEDLLHPNLDWTTFTPVTASHDYRIEITDGNQVEFIFDNINLPHEAADEAGSNGFVAYKIKPVEDIQIGDMITGTASIFFDYNLPIITNSADTEVMEFLGVNNYELNTVSVYPNPTKGTVHFNALNNTSIESIKIYNLQGSEIMAFEGYQESIDVQNLSTGIYLLNIQTDKGISRHRLIKE